MGPLFACTGGMGGGVGTGGVCCCGRLPMTTEAQETGAELFGACRDSVVEVAEGEATAEVCGSPFSNHAPRPWARLRSWLVVSPLFPGVTSF